MKYNTIECKVGSDQVAWVNLKRAEKHNALNPEMMRELVAAFKWLATDESIRAVVLSAEGNSFCAGGDLGWMRENLDKPRAERVAESSILAQLFTAIDSCPKLVIGRINGPAYGGGVGLVAVCDIAIGVDTASFALTEVRLGLVPANIAPFVLRKMGVSNLRRTALNATRFDAHKAQSLGLLDAVVAADELDAAVAFEIKLALSVAPGAIATTKGLLADLNKGSLQNVSDHVVSVLADVWEGEEAQAGIRAFFDKIPPPWKPE